MEGICTITTSISSRGISLLFHHLKSEVKWNPVHFFGVIKYSDWRQLFAGLLLVPICASLFIWVERHAFHFAYQRHSGWCSGYSEIFTCDAWKTVPLDSATFYPLLWVSQFWCLTPFPFLSTHISFFLLKRIFDQLCHHVHYLTPPNPPLLCTICSPVKMLIIRSEIGIGWMFVVVQKK